MEYVIIGICVIAVIVVGILLYLKNKQKIKSSEDPSSLAISNPAKSESLKTDSSNELIIQIEILPVEAIADETRLVEITDNKVLAHINNLIPGLTQAGNAVNNIVQTAKTNKEVLYRAIIPANAKLTDSRAMEGALRGFYSGVDGIQGHANFVAFEVQKGTTVVANKAAAAMGVASMVVGQYYMTQINVELKLISDGISQIQDFQENKYRSRLFSLITHVKKIADFQTEILENDELRLSKICQLDSLEEECTQLLGQANLTLARFTEDKTLDYVKYEKVLHTVQNWFMYQKSLLEVLYKISELRYTLHFGAVSKEHCIALLPTYMKQTSDTHKKLVAWHNKNIKQFGIKIDKICRKRAGFDGVIHFIPGLFNNDLNFRRIEKQTVNMITTQKSGHHNVHQIDTSELYAEDVQLISKNGKLYYLPESKAE